MDELVQIELLILELLLIVSIVAVAVRHFRIPYTVALVLAGLALSLNSPLGIELTPSLILSLFIPPLVFEAAVHINLSKLRKNLTTIILLAVPGVVLTMVLVGGIVSLGVGIPIQLALVFGALIAATDPVSVVAIFRKLGAPKRLEVLLEGESLFNDGTAIVIFNLAVVAYLTGQFNLLQGGLDFVRVAGGGLLVGLALGWLASRLIAQIDDHLVETTLTTVLAFGSFLVAEELLHVSGVLAVVAAGLINGNIGPQGMSPTTRIVVLNFWEYVAFLANSAVFLLIGLDIELPALIADLRHILWAIVAILVARAITIYGLSRLGRGMPRPWRHVLYWGGLRGAIALALALSLSPEFGAGRETLIVMTFGVVLFTLLIQGMTMGGLVRRLGIISVSQEQQEYERRHARALAAQTSYDHIDRLHRQGLISSHTWDVLSPTLKRRGEALKEAVQEVLHHAPQLEMGELQTARRELLRSQRSTLATLRRDGVISEEIYTDLVTEIDMALDSGVDLWARYLIDSEHKANVTQLVSAVVQEEDAETVGNALAIRGIPSTRVQSKGGLLQNTSYVFMVGVPEGHLQEVVEAIDEATMGRVKYVEHPMADVGAPLQDGRAVDVKGATVFVFDVDRYEEI
jgi:CPA1 family monovalent cation:H+ antiporter